MNRKISSVGGIALVLFLLLGSDCPAADDPEGRAVILAFHHVSDQTPAVTSISPVAFQDILDLLDGDPAYKVLPLSTIVTSLQSGDPLPPRTVALTFDDGYESIYSEAFPMLKRRGYPFTVFVCPSAIDSRSGPVMTWDQLREMAGQGGSIANHSNSHLHLQRHQSEESSESWRSRIRSDLLAAEQRIIREIGKTERLFAFPFGEYDEELLALIEDLDLIGFGQQSGPVGRGSDFRLLPRFPVSGQYTDLPDLALKLDTRPFPLADLVSANPLIDVGSPAPVLRLVVAGDGFPLDRVSAFASGQGRADVRRMDGALQVFEIQAKKPFLAGRFRYNITMPSPDGEFWFWYSQLWIVGDSHED